MSENRVAGHGGMASHGSMSPYSSSAGESSWTGRGNQQYSGSSSWVQQQQAWGQQQQVSEVAWPSRSPSWGSQQQSYSPWQPQAQQLPLSGSQYSPSQHARSPSVASPASSHSFHSPSHHPYTSPTHSLHMHQGYSSPASSSSQQSYAHSPTQYQSPTQEMYLPSSYQRHGYHQYPSGHSFQTSYSGQQYPQQNAGQSYKSPPVTQAYISSTTTNPNPPYQSPSGNIVHPSSNSSQTYRSPSNNQSTSPNQTFGSNNGPPNKACQNSPSSSYQSHCYQSPPYSHPYYSPSHSARHSTASASSGMGHFQKGIPHMKTPEQSGQMSSKCQTASSLLKPLGDKQSVPILSSVEEKLSASQAKNVTGDTIPGKQSTKSNSVDFLSDLHVSNVGNKPANQEHSSVSSQTKLSPTKNNHGTHRSTLSGSLKSQNLFALDTNIKPDKWNSLCSNDQGDCSMSSKLADDVPSSVERYQTPKSISRLGFIPTDTTAESCIKNEDSKTLVTTACEAKSGKPSVVCSTPMIQQLLMEESPAKLNIKPEDREAVMKKPMLSPTRPQKKTKSSRGKAKSVVRPRSASLSVGHFSRSESYGNHLPMLSSTPNPMLNRAGRSHSITLPFGKHPGLIEPMHEWHQQPPCHPVQQHQQQNFSPIPQWQQQQHQWGGNQWQDSASVDGAVGSGASQDKESPVNRTQQRSYSADCASLLYTQPNNNFRQEFERQQEPLYSSSGNSDVIVSSEAGSRGESIEENGNENDPSSLSNLYQLVSDVSFDGEDNVWENSPTTIVPGFLQDPMENETPKSSSPSADGQDSPDKKDFITLEPPSKTSSDRAGSDTTGMTSSEESDRMDYEIAADLIPSQLKSTDFAAGWIHPRLGKQNRMKRMGLVSGKGSVSGSSLCNPSYTYTFHVPTPVFKKLKFFRSAQARKQDLKVIRMHPMDARRYSLLKIGKELVQVNRLSESDLAKYNCTLPSLAELNQMTSDGLFSRVNLDIPSASSSRSSFNSFGEEGSSFSHYDSDFPPNKVAPPSSFSVTQVTTSPSRSTHSLTPPVLSQSSSRTTQYTVMAPVSQYGMPGTSVQTVGSQLSDGTGSHHQGQQPVHQEGMYDSYRVGQSYMPRYNHIGGDQGSGNGLPQMNGQMGDQNFHHPSNPHACHYSPSHQAVGNTSGPVISSYVQPLQYQQQSRSRNDPQTYWDPKNGSRSPGQHGPIGTIDMGSCSGHSGKDEENNALQTSTGTFSINTRVNAQTFNSHAKFRATHIDSDIIDADSCSRQSSLRDGYDRNEEFLKDEGAFVEISSTKDCLNSTSLGHMKRRKTRRKRSK